MTAPFQLFDLGRLQHPPLTRPESLGRQAGKGNAA
jgi:hypothetical protein